MNTMQKYLPMFFFHLHTCHQVTEHQAHSYNATTLFLYIFQVHSPLLVTVLSVDEACTGDENVECSLPKEQREYLGVSREIS